MSAFRCAAAALLILVTACVPAEVVEVAKKAEANGERMHAVGAVSYGWVERVDDRERDVSCYVLTGSSHGVASIDCVEMTL